MQQFRNYFSGSLKVLTKPVEISFCREANVFRLTSDASREPLWLQAPSRHNPRLNKEIVHTPRQLESFARMVLGSVRAQVAGFTFFETFKEAGVA